jgi:hypothetical protein
VALVRTSAWYGQHGRAPPTRIKLATLRCVLATSLLPQGVCHTLRTQAPQAVDEAWLQQHEVLACMAASTLSSVAALMAAPPAGTATT